MGVVAGEISVDYSYMIFGGISFYLNDFQRGFSLAQNVDALFFEQGAKLYPEFLYLYWNGDADKIYICIDKYAGET